MSHSTLAIPTPDLGWLLVSGGREIGRDTDLSALAGKRSDVLVAIPSARVSTFLVDLPPVEEALHGAMIQAQVDKRGLSGKAAPLVDYSLLSHGESGDTFSVQVVTELPLDCILPSAAGYTTAAALQGKDSLGVTATLWREAGRLVLGVFSSGLPVHVQVLSGKPEIGKSSGQEVNLVLLGLRGESFFERESPRDLVIAIDGVDEPGLIAFRSALSLPVRSEPARLPVLGTARDRLLPAEVHRNRRRRRSAVRNLALLAVGLVLYTVLGVWIWKEAKATEREMASLDRRLAIIQPDVERIQLAEERWRSLEPAFEKDLFPVVQLSRITSALPGSGVVVREYRTTGRNIRIRGQARDVQLANRLLEDLQGMNGFERYEWSMPNPRVERNNTATFEIQGKLKHEGADS
ncbi:MAG: hypothetical protein KDN18_02580 [Verrucomicrobiae bacterium]|nr:hypothetical protein [Verrucomicrobiae bacterium]